MSRRLVRSASDRQEEEDKFDANDDDGDGQLDEAELVEAFAAAGESQELEEDEDGDGVVDAKDFDGMHNLIKDHDAVKISADGVKRFSRQGTRECTDVICIFFFLAWWIGMAIIGIIAVKKGDYRRLVYGTDYTGEQCNQGPNAGKEWMYYPNLEKDLFVWYNSGGTDSFTPGGLCLTKCPDIGTEVYMDGKAFPVKYTLDPILFHCFPMYDAFEARLAMCSNYSCPDYQPLDITIPENVKDGMVVTSVLSGALLKKSVHLVEHNSTHAIEVSTEYHQQIIATSTFRFKQISSRRQLGEAHTDVLGYSGREGRRMTVEPVEIGVTQTLKVPGLTGTLNEWGAAGGEWELDWEDGFEEEAEEEVVSDRGLAAAGGGGGDEPSRRGEALRGEARRLGAEQKTCTDYVRSCGGFRRTNCTWQTAADESVFYTFSPVLCYPPAGKSKGE
jgi:hypothetical protein